MHSFIARHLQALWWSPRPTGLAWLLWPLTWPYRALFAIAQWRARRLVTPLPVPLVVVGNLIVGGAGKTPTVVALVRALRVAGWHPGVVSRGYGRSPSAPRALAMRTTFDAASPATLRTLYKSFADDAEMLAMLVDASPPVVSFHFGLPSAEVLSALRTPRVVMMATATSLEEARAIAAAGIDVIVAQGIEAGGHRGMFDPTKPDEALGTIALTHLLVREIRRPVIAAGGIMDGPGIAAALNLGAVAAQLGTAFIACPESSADDAVADAHGVLRGIRHCIQCSVASGSASISCGRAGPSTTLGTTK